MIITLNRLRHCESFNFCWELEIALNEFLTKDSIVITPNIAMGEGNAVFHVKWDNVKKILTNMHGSSIVNSTGGIMIQEVKSDCTYDKTQSCNDSLQPKDNLDLLCSGTTNHLQSIYIAFRTGLSIPEDVLFIPPPADNLQYNLALNHCRT